MNKVRILPESLIRLIAAGEVIERPASVIKELVENSLDAGATSISIDLWGAGRTRIRISDDGEGMSPEDAKTALERHATSKLKNFDDLESMATFGFRGEALPSIAAVSRLELSTRTPQAKEGWMLQLEGGKLINEKAVGRPVGTTIDVQDLFYNTPARAKFVKRDSTERSHVLKTVQEIALAHPTVRFTCSMDGKEMLSLTPTKELGQRIADLWGLSAAEDLVPLDITQGPCRIRGFVNAVKAHHATRAYQILFINQRPVQQRMLNHAIYEAYREWLPVGRHPVYCLFVDLDPGLVDVNVHPTKREVRLSDERAVYDVLYKCIRALHSVPVKAASTSSRSPFSFSGSAPSFQQPKTPAPSTIAATLELQAPFLVAPEPTPANFLNLRFLGQFQNLYLLFEQGEELLLLDQHAASERVLYERLLTKVQSEQAPRQTLMTPIIWDVSPSRAESIRHFLGEFDRLGFLLEPFGANSFALKEWPTVLPETKQAQRFLEEVAEKLEEERSAGSTDVQHRIAASAACRAAVMAGDPLTPQEVLGLVEDLSACERPMTCPHGRPTHIRLPIADFHRRFART